MNSSDFNRYDEQTRRRFISNAAKMYLGVNLFPMLGGSIASAAPAASATPKAKNVIYLFMSGGMSHLDTFDPKKKKDAKRFETVSYDKVLADNLKVMDAAAVALCRDNGIPIVVFSIREKGNLARVLAGNGVQTIVNEEG